MLGSFPILYKPKNHKVTSSPCSRAIEAERIVRSLFSNVNALSHSEIILVTEDGSPPTVSDDPRATAACESRRFFRFPKNCQILCFGGLEKETSVHFIRKC